MALFSPDTKEAKKTKAKPSSKKIMAPLDGRHHTVLTAPWLSEKALIGTENGVYAFQIPAHANKFQVAAAVEAIYGVKPRQIRVVNLPAKKKPLRNRRGQGARAARHKAYVYLKKGDTIQFA